MPTRLYTLGGWSPGGTIAFEKARQFREQGQEVALLALFDSKIVLELAVSPDDYAENELLINLLDQSIIDTLKMITSTKRIAQLRCLVQHCWSSISINSTFYWISLKEK